MNLIQILASKYSVCLLLVMIEVQAKPLDSFIENKNLHNNLTEYALDLKNSDIDIFDSVQIYSKLSGTIEAQLIEVGINIDGVDPDIMQDALLSVVSLRRISELNLNVY